MSGDENAEGNGRVTAAVRLTNIERDIQALSSNTERDIRALSDDVRRVLANQDREHAERLALSAVVAKHETHDAVQDATTAAIVTRIKTAEDDIKALEKTNRQWDWASIVYASVTSFIGGLVGVLKGP